MSAEDPFAAERARMIREQLQSRGITDARVLEAMGRIPRHLFVAEDQQIEAYSDHALPIDDGQTISQPYIVGLMSQALRLSGSERVLEVGSGSGYQTAILCLLAREVYSIEQSRLLAEKTVGRLAQLGLKNARVFVGDGGYGLVEFAPYDAILCAAAPPSVPDPLRQQLTPQGGRLVLPVGGAQRQFLLLIERTGEQFRARRLSAVRFVPLVGRYGEHSDAGDRTP
ncbi:MAG: protein-L-isoaspartate(D-aspartate) O-methyltransferase [Anaerolineae bacterium]|nr:protein-L-isoaspartate(D-aspartate) O-methyltransferase [Anaerolineae bacterium]NUQ03935.1 protein-L-isoaspartate(D-aspartate) O-methyltransferase [Anaerolineae bacterium]